MTFAIIITAKTTQEIISTMFQTSLVPPIKKADVEAANDISAHTVSLANSNKPFFMESFIFSLCLFKVLFIIISHCDR